MCELTFLMCFIYLFTFINCQSCIGNCTNGTISSFVLCSFYKNCTSLNFPTFISPPLQQGWKQLNDTNFYVQTPYDLPNNLRYKRINNTYNFFVYDNDTRHNIGSTDLNPRSEYRSYYNFMNGTASFDAFVKLPCNMSGYIFFQIFGGSNTAYIFRTNSGNLMDYPYTKNFCNDWHYINATMTLNSYTNVTQKYIYLDNVLVHNASIIKPGPIFFKCGAYMGKLWNYSRVAETFYHNIRISTYGNVTWV